MFFAICLERNFEILKFTIVVDEFQITSLKFDLKCRHNKSEAHESTIKTTFAFACVRIEQKGLKQS